MTKTLVTGAAGFLGSHVVDALVARGDEIVGLDNCRRGRLEQIQRHINEGAIDFRRADIREYALVRDAVEGCDLVLHLAAQSNVMGAGQDPDYSFSTNVLGTYNVVKAASEAGVPRLVFSSSREVYGEPANVPVHEGDALDPKNLYGASKMAGEAYCRAFDAATPLACTILRFGNLYGSRDRDRVIPLWIERAASGEDLLLYGGRQVLDFLHVSYAVEAVLAAAGYAGIGPVNVASGRGTSLQELADRVLGAIESGSSVRFQPAREVEVTRFVASVDRMSRDLGVAPPVDPLDHLEELIAAATDRAAPP